jgi:hypothetical protein
VKAAFDTLARVVPPPICLRRGARYTLTLSWDETGGWAWGGPFDERGSVLELAGRGTTGKTGSTDSFVARGPGVTTVVFLAAPPCPSQCDVQDQVWRQTIEVISHDL